MPPHEPKNFKKINLEKVYQDYWKRKIIDNIIQEITYMLSEIKYCFCDTNAVRAIFVYNGVLFLVIFVDFKSRLQCINCKDYLCSLHKTLFIDTF
jgi:hypothetical protein